MDTENIYKTYLRQGTGGFAVIRKFYSRYADILSRTGLLSIDDVIHEVFLSISKTDLSDVRDHEHYLMRAIKLHCWSLLDKAIRQKKDDVRGNSIDDKNEENAGLLHAAAEPERTLSELEGNELIAQINLFKLLLKPQEVTLLNCLIDGSGRSEIAETLGMNMNTLDTNIRRIRVKLAGYLKELGYIHNGLERFI